MADTGFRQPLGVISVTRPNPNIQQVPNSPGQGNKRTHETAGLDARAACNGTVTPTKLSATVVNGRRSVKRVKADINVREDTDITNERIRAKAEEEYAVKLKAWIASYRRQFPSLRFYFDGCPEDDVRRCSRRIIALGGVVEQFFSNNVNVLVTTRDIPGNQDANSHSAQASRATSQQLQSFAFTHNQSRVIPNGFPFAQSLTEAATKAEVQNHDVLVKAQALGIKIWTLKKLRDSVLKNLFADQTQQTNPRTLSHTLRSEKYLGPNEENVVQFRGPFLLVRDMSEYYKPIMCREWPKVNNAKDGEWPQWRNTRPGRCPFTRDKYAEDNKHRVLVTQMKPERPRTLNQFQYANASGIQQITSAIQSNIGRSGWSGKENLGSGVLNLQKKAVTAKRSTRLNANVDPTDTKKVVVDIKAGYCENCKEKFEDFDAHLRTRQHRNYAKDEKNFHELDELLEELVRAPRIDAQFEA